MIKYSIVSYMLEYEIYFEAKEKSPNLLLVSSVLSEISKLQGVHPVLEELPVFNQSEERLHH